MRNYQRRNKGGTSNASRLAHVFVSLLFLGWTWSLMVTISLSHQHREKKDPPVSVEAMLARASPAAAAAQQDDIAQPVYGTHNVWGDTEVVYALPQDSSPKGIVLLLHACTHNALKFFSPSDSCPACVGLSEELRIVRLVLSRGYAALAVTCRDTKSGCWSDADIPRLTTALGVFQTHLPTSVNNVIAIGASSGGHMAAKMVAEGHAVAALVMVMGLRPALVNRLKESKSPIYLAPMPRDKVTTRITHENYQELHCAKAPVILDNTTCVARPVTSAYLCSRVPGMTKELAERIVQGLLDAGHLQQDFMLQKDPTKSNWRVNLQKMDSKQHSSTLLWGDFDLTPGKSPLAKALHRAWAFHEYCSEVVEPALDFFEQVLAKE